VLRSSDLAWMQDTQERAMPGTVVIERYALTSDGMGGKTEAWSAVGTVTGRIYPVIRRAAAEAVRGAQVVSETAWFATLPVGTVVDARDRLVYESRSWEVVAVNNDSMYQTAVRCELKSHNEERRA
jgi:head-tail adaptor